MYGNLGQLVGQLSMVKFANIAKKVTLNRETDCYILKTNETSRREVKEDHAKAG